MYVRVSPGIVSHTGRHFNIPGPKHRVTDTGDISVLVPLAGWLICNRCVKLQVLKDGKSNIASRLSVWWRPTFQVFQMCLHTVTRVNKITQVSFTRAPVLVRNVDPLSTFPKPQRTSSLSGSGCSMYIWGRLMNIQTMYSPTGVTWCLERRVSTVGSGLWPLSVKELKEEGRDSIQCTRRKALLPCTLVFLDLQSLSESFHAFPCVNTSRCHAPPLSGHSRWHSLLLP